MIGTKESVKKINDKSYSLKNNGSGKRGDYHSCGSCNTCHHMTRVQGATVNPIFGGTNHIGPLSNLQKSCVTSFVQRNLGNNYIQSMAGNRQASRQATPMSWVPEIQKKCSCGGSYTGCSGKEQELEGIQTKLTIGTVNDVYEQEADRAAEQVMQMSESSVQTENYSNVASNVQKLSAYEGSTPGSDQDIELNQSGGRPLSSATLKFMEPRFCADFGHVRLHTDQDAQHTAAQIQAKAFTHGNNIWLGKGAHEDDKGLVAHELTHVIQQGAATPSADRAGAKKSNINSIQRDARPACPDGTKTITVDLVSLRDSNRNPGDDLDFANSIFRPCCVQFQQGTGVSVAAADSDTWLGGDTVLDRSTACGAVSPEARSMYDGAAADYGINSPFRTFYVASMNPADRADSLPPFCATGPAAPYVNTVRVTNTGARRSLAHEFGHILLNSASHTGIDNPADTSNLMVPTNSATGETLDATQCATIFSNA